MPTLFEIVDAPPDVGEPVWYYPGASAWRGETGMLLRFTHPDGTTWLAMLGGPRDGPTPMPDGKHLYACGLVLNPADPNDWGAFSWRVLNLTIGCPRCANDMSSDPSSIALAESPTGAMLECGRCGEISQWRFDAEPSRAEQITPMTWGGKV